MSNNNIIINTQEIVALVLDGVRSYSRIQALLVNPDNEVLFYDTLDVFCRNKAPQLLQKGSFTQSGSSLQAFLCKCFENIFLDKCRKWQAKQDASRFVPFDEGDVSPSPSCQEGQEDGLEWVRACISGLPPTAKRLALALLAGEEPHCTSAARKISLSRRKTELAKKQIIRAIMEHPCASGMLHRLERNAKKRCEREISRAIANEGHQP